MRISLRHVDQCPNLALAEQRLREAVDLAGVGPVVIDRELVDSHARAEQLGFVGSPTILLNGRDPFAAGAAEVGLSCRIYATQDGMQTAPSVAQLVDALAAAANATAREEPT